MVEFISEEFIVDHEPWMKIPRFFDSKIVLTEKIDGTNGLIYINTKLDGEDYIQAGSRNRWLSLEDDNFGFAKWVNENKEELVSLLGPGYHYGEWWGQGIQRRYGMDRKVFSLFNVHRWKDLWDGYHICDVVPHLELNIGEFNPSEYEIDMCDDFDIAMKSAHDYFMDQSRAAGKYGVDFKTPEGFVIFHERSRQIFKVPINK